MSHIDFASEQLNKIDNRIQLAASNARRDPSEIKLIGASKQQSAELINDFHHAGLSNVGENYLQEALIKQNKLNNSNIDWHFIGKVQSNKCKTIAQHFDWVHSVDRTKIAKGLARFRSEAKMAPLNMLVQLNVDGEESKGGVSMTEVPTLCDQLTELDGVRLRGLMLIPAPNSSSETQRKPFALARETLELTNQQYGLRLDTLSMGMSNDLEAAISEGSTMIRVGTALFGARPQNSAD